MADADLPKNWEGASRWFLGGTIVFASGFEAVVLFWEGKYLPALGSLCVAIVLMAILLNWDRLKSKMPRVAAAFTATAADSKLWLLVAFVLIWSVLPRSTPIDWIFGAPIFVGMMLFLVAFNYARPKSLNDGSTIYAPSVAVSPQAPKDPQVERDLVLLLDFAVYQTTALMLDDLIRQAPSGIDEKSVVDLSGDPAVRYQTALDYVRRLVNKLDPGTYRGSAFRSLMYSCAFRRS